MVSLVRPVDKEPTLKLNEFRTLYRYYRRYIGWFDHLLLAVLLWIESKVIITRTVNTVDEAVENYLSTVPPVEAPKPVYTEIPATTEDSSAAQLLGFSEMRLTAPHSVKGGR